MWRATALTWGRASFRWSGWSARACVEAEVEVKAKVKDEVEVEDYRRVEQPREALAELVERGEVAIWREGEGAGDIPGHDRWSLPRAATLVIWTAPPGPAELRATLAQVEPARICLFGRDPGADTPDAFIRRLTGLVKHALNVRGGRAPIGPLAAATAHRERPPCGSASPGWPLADTCASLRKRTEKYSSRPVMASALLMRTSRRWTPICAPPWPRLPPTALTSAEADAAALVRR